MKARLPEELPTHSPSLVKFRDFATYSLPMKVMSVPSALCALITRTADATESAPVSEIALVREQTSMYDTLSSSKYRTDRPISNGQTFEYLFSQEHISRIFCLISFILSRLFLSFTLKRGKTDVYQSIITYESLSKSTS